MQADHRKMLVKTIRDSLWETEGGWEIEEIPATEENADVIIDEVWELFCSNLNYYGVPYNADSLWDEFTPIVGDCMAEAIREKKITEYASRN